MNLDLQRRSKIFMYGDSSKWLHYFLQLTANGKSGIKFKKHLLPVFIMSRGWKKIKILRLQAFLSFISGLQTYRALLLLDCSEFAFSFIWVFSLLFKSCRAQQSKNPSSYFLCSVHKHLMLAIIWSIYQARRTLLLTLCLWVLYSSAD